MPKKGKNNEFIRKRVKDNVCDLSLTELSEIPVAEIASYKRVNVLDLSSNRLTALGKNFLSLTRLVRLDLSKNQLKTLPEEFGHLCNLRHLDLYDNKLEYLPISFGNLVKLRYLDLKENPLIPALLQIVGYCSTTKECQASARNTVKFMASMQIEAENIKEKVSDEQPDLYDEAIGGDQNLISDYNQNMHENQNMQTQQKSKRTSKKAKSKKNKNHQNSPGLPKGMQTLPMEIKCCNCGVSNMINSTNVNSSSINVKSGRRNGKAILGGGNGNGNGSSNSTKNQRKGRTLKSTALSSIMIFFSLLVINVFIIYLATFKNPEITEFIVNIIPQQYRNWIVQKTEIFRLHVTDWISHFITTPNEN